MSLSLREKQSLYHRFGQLLRSGITFSKAVESLAKTARGQSKQLLSGLKTDILEGHGIVDSFARQRPMIGEMEVGMIAAVERTGRLEYGFTQLSEYFGALDRARSNIIKRTAYPIFVLHFGVLVVNLKDFFAPAGAVRYLHHTIGTFVVVYASAVILAALVYFLRKAGGHNAAVDSLLRHIPLFGKVRRAFAVSRFCATYEMQLNAGVNVMDALTIAERASQSGLIRGAVETGLPKLRNGSQPGELLAESGAFPQAMVESFCVAEESGELEHELTRLAAEYQAEALSRLEILVEWTARLIYIAVLLYVGYGIVMFYKSYLETALKMGDPSSL